MLEKWTIGSENRLFKPNPSKVKPLDGQRSEQLRDALKSYRKHHDESAGLELSESRMQILDVAERIGAGTGSLGNQRFYALIRETDQDSEEHDFILDIKLQHQPTAYGYMSQEETDEYNQNFSSHAIRHADAYRALSDFPDHHLGWLNLEHESYSIRERCPYKRDFDTTQLSSKAFLLMAKQWGEVLALKHRRAARRLTDHQTTSTFENKLNLIAHEQPSEFQYFVRSVTQPYAEQVRRDWKDFHAHLDALVMQ